jgi:predicted secreted protein
VRLRQLMLAGVTMFWFGCSDFGLPTNGVMNASVNGRIFVFPVGKIFVMELDVHATAGYGWICHMSDTSVVRLDSTSFRPKNRDILEGGVTVETFRFRMNKPGECTIDLNELRRWETGVRPINSLRFHVRVL